MKANQMRVFEGAGVAGLVMLSENGKPIGDYLEVGANGMLVIPKGVNPQGFHIVVAIKDGSRAFIVQKDIGTTGGDYASKSLSELKSFAKGFKVFGMREPIQVRRVGKDVWTNWHGKPGMITNRVDRLGLGQDGQLDLFQVGVVVRGDSASPSFKLLGRYRWRGELRRRADGKLVAVPADSKWGSFNGGSSNREQLFQHPEFRKLLESTNLKVWDGADAVLDPKQAKVNGPQEAAVLWHNEFGSQRGAGIVQMSDGKTAWVQTPDIINVEPDEDGEICLYLGQIVTFSGKVENWGAKADGPPKLTGVKLVKRP